MIELKVKDTKCNTKFHFRTMDDCEKFLYVFKDRWCNVPWEKPVIISDNTKLLEYEKSAISEDPQLRAERNLDWGWNLARELGTDAPNKQQEQFLNNIMKLF